MIFQSLVTDNLGITAIEPKGSLFFYKRREALFFDRCRKGVMKVWELREVLAR